jgi:hypothetical protein
MDQLIEIHNHLETHLHKKSEIITAKCIFNACVWLNKLKLYSDDVI